MSVVEVFFFVHRSAHQLIILKAMTDESDDKVEKLGEIFREFDKYKFDHTIPVFCHDWL